mmetsp:Transcript_89934/g.142088  ORF Transcript_89934/g.142088 Transcript_89934/m.142088 type:complete len:475 (-) Transcript_89934:284-1708(-)
MSARRYCFASLPKYLSELPNGPRIGPVNRPGYEPSWDAAGHPFHDGEHDSRNVMIVDDLPHKLAHDFDITGAAGLCSPRVELRAVTVDGPMRRARSSPPDIATTRLVQQRSLQAFGVRAEIDSPRFRRRVCSVQSPSPTRDQASKMASRFSNIDEIVAKKHFHFSAGPGAWMSPRYAARCTELIDIDSHGGRIISPRKTLAAEGILPAKESFELAPTNGWTFEQTPRRHNMTYFSKTLEAEKNAKLLGRAQSRSRPTESLKLENLQKRERGWQMYASSTKERSCLQMQACDWSFVSSEPNSPIGHVRGTMRSSISVVSTAASLEDSVRSDLEPKLSKASRSILNSLFGADCENATSGRVAEDCDYEEQSSKKVPLGIRRLMASMLPDRTDLTDSMVNELQGALGKSVQKLARSSTKAIHKNVGARAKIPLQPHDLSSPSRRHASVAGQGSNSTRREEIDKPSFMNKAEEPVVAG